SRQRHGLRSVPAVVAPGGTHAPAVALRAGGPARAAAAGVRRCIHSHGGVGARAPRLVARVVAPAGAWRARRDRVPTLPRSTTGRDARRVAPRWVIAKPGSPARGGGRAGVG